MRWRAGIQRAPTAACAVLSCKWTRRYRLRTPLVSSRRAVGALSAEQLAVLRKLGGAVE